MSYIYASEILVIEFFHAESKAGKGKDYFSFTEYNAHIELLTDDYRKFVYYLEILQCYLNVSLAVFILDIVALSVLNCFS